MRPYLLKEYVPAGPLFLHSQNYSNAVDNIGSSSKTKNPRVKGTKPISGAEAVAYSLTGSKGRA